MDQNLKDLLVIAIIGIIAGFLASIIVGGGGIVQYLVSGLLGAFVGTYLLNALGVNLGIANPLLSKIVTSAIGAIVVVILARLIS